MDAAASPVSKGERVAGDRGSARGPGWPLLLAVYIALALALKATTFGDLNRHYDETFYFLVGQRMHEGLLPYVDVWDRKPFGLFLIYYLIAGLSTSVWTYQLIACAMAAATALVIARIVAVLAGDKGGAAGGLAAGLCYLFAIGPFEGSTGQTPDFYNLMVAGAALLALSGRDMLASGRAGWRAYGAMGLCGLALTIKQTTIFESLFLGLFILWSLWRAGQSPARLAGVALAFGAIGAAPTLAIAGFYWQAGHWSEFWHAMVTSNLAKMAEGGGAWRALGISLRALPLIALALAGVAAARASPAGRFAGGWLLAAVLGFLSVPNFYSHYALPVIVPLSVAAGLTLAAARMRAALVVLVALWAMTWHSPMRAGGTGESIRTMRALSASIERLDTGGGLLVYEAPPYLYSLTGKRFLSPLVFPHHLNHAIENDVSHLSTHAEVDRVLAGRPGVIAMAQRPRSLPVNVGSRARILAWARANCPAVEIITQSDGDSRIPIVLFGRCREGRASAKPTIG